METNYKVVQVTPGKGKYDDEAEAVRLKTGGSVILLVLDGAKGMGFSVQVHADVVLSIPGMLRYCADDIEREIRYHDIRKVRDV